MEIKTTTVRLSNLIDTVRLAYVEDDDGQKYELYAINNNRLGIAKQNANLCVCVSANSLVSLWQAAHSTEDSQNGL